MQAREVAKGRAAPDHIAYDACEGLPLPRPLPLHRGPLLALFSHLPWILRHGPYAFLTLAAQSVELLALCQRPTAPVAAVDIKTVFILFHVSSRGHISTPSPPSRCTIPHGEPVPGQGRRFPNRARKDYRQKPYYLYPPYAGDTGAPADAVRCNRCAAGSPFTRCESTTLVQAIVRLSHDTMPPLPSPLLLEEKEEYP